MARTVLVVDDERNMRWVLEQALQKAGYAVLTAANGVEALQTFACNAVDLVMLDLKMPNMDGLSLLRELRQRNTNIPILLLTAYASVPTAVEAMRVGANDYLRKPFDIETMLSKVHEHIVLQQDQAFGREQNALSEEIGFANGFEQFIGSSLKLVKPLEQAAVAIQHGVPVSVIGEPGSGRRHLARLIHQQSATSRAGRLLQIDCQTTPETLLWADLHPESGRWHQALGGSLLLANVECLSNDLIEHCCVLLADYLQAALRPHGIRLLLTTQAPLVKSWTPLTDPLFSIELPPLRQRMGDLYPLLAAFTPDATWDTETQAALAAYQWPGNVAELRRVALQATHLAGQQPIQLSHLPAEIVTQPQQTTTSLVSDQVILPSEGIDLEKLEKNLIQQALVMAEGNKSQMARLLGLTRATLLYRLEKYDIVG